MEFDVFTLALGLLRKTGGHAVVDVVQYVQAMIQDCLNVDTHAVCTTGGSDTMHQQEKCLD